MSVYDVFVTDDEMKLTISIMVAEARDRLGWDRKKAAVNTGLAYNTLSDLERTGGKPSSTTRKKLELGYGLRPGSLGELWAARRDLEFGSVTLDTLLDPHARPRSWGTTNTGKASPILVIAPARRASELSDQELMAELSFRFLMRQNGEHAQ